MLVCLYTIYQPLSDSRGHLVGWRYQHDPGRWRPVTERAVSKQPGLAETTSPKPPGHVCRLAAASGYVSSHRALAATGGSPFHSSGHHQKTLFSVTQASVVRLLEAAELAQTLLERPLKVCRPHRSPRERLRNVD